VIVLLDLAHHKKIVFKTFDTPKIKLMLFNLLHFVAQKVGLFIKKYEMKCGVQLESTKTEKHGNCENNRGNI